MFHTFFIILLLEGFITISVEILTMRQLTPFFGGSVLITSIIIGVFLLFLALGYWRGGRCQTSIFQQLSRNFSFSIIWIGLGLSYSLIMVFFYFSAVYLGMPFLLSLSLYLLVVLAPIVYWLGQTIPLTTNLFNQELRVSDISGTSLFISTMGSFLGAILTSLILFQFLGVAWTIVINCVLLFLLVLYMRPQSQQSWYLMLSLLCLLVFIKIVNVNYEKTRFLKTNNYANYEVIKPTPSSRIFKINDSYSSSIDANKKGFAYIEFIRDLLFQKLHLRHKQILVIGAGGFTLSANGAYDNQVTYVDIDPEIKTLVETYFLRSAINGQFIGQDARAYLHQHQEKFDAIISDAYSNQVAIPPSLLTVDYFKALAEHLNDSGVLIVNIISNPLFDDQYGKHIFNTIHAVFPYCTISFSNWKKSSVANMIYVCPNVSSDRTVYTDDLSTATLDFFNRKHVL